MFNELKSRIVSSPPAPRGLPALPSGWRYERLRSVAELRVSGVDKLTLDDESPVRLCNYTDVYKNDYIVDKPGYMSATASRAEIARFRLEQDDVVITKDSETWNDIAVPAYVVDAAHDFVCAYHLAIVRPRRSLLRGSYLHHALREPRIANQFHVAASGVTRFGLTQDAIKSVQVPVPPMDEQAAIVKYLGHAHARIDRAIAAKRKLIALLEEQKQAIIHQAVTRGLDPSVPLKDSGTPWLGKIPAHWEVCRAKYLFKEFDIRSGTGSERLLSLRAIAGLVFHDEVSERLIGPEVLTKYKKVRPGHLVMNRMRAASGLFAIAATEGLVSPDYSTMEVSEAVDARYYLRLFKTRAAMAEFRQQSSGLGTGESGFMRLYSERFGRIPLSMPPPAEQEAISGNLATVEQEVNEITIRATREVELLREFRTRLTSDVVTGQVDVREIAAALPEFTGEVLVAADDEFGDDGELVESELEFAGADE